MFKLHQVAKVAEQRHWIEILDFDSNTIQRNISCWLLYMILRMVSSLVALYTRDGFSENARTKHQCSNVKISIHSWEDNAEDLHFH